MSRTPPATGSIRFEVRDGIRRVTCTVLDEALDAVSGLALPSTPMLRRRAFDRFRTLINAAATLKLAGLPASASIELTHDDLRRVPVAAGAPAFGTAGRGK